MIKAISGHSSHFRPIFDFFTFKKTSLWMVFLFKRENVFFKNTLKDLISLHSTVQRKWARTFDHLLFYNTKLWRKKKKSKIERLNLKTITSAQNQKRQNTLQQLSIGPVPNIYSEPSWEFLFSEANSEMIETVTARLHKLILVVQDSSTTFVRRREFSWIFTSDWNLQKRLVWITLRFPPIKRITYWIQWKKTSAFKFELHWDVQIIFRMKLSGFIPFIMLIRNFQNNKPPQ